MKETEEREVKLEVPPGFELPELPGEQLEQASFSSTYHDTEDRRLARFGVTLRRRVEKRKGLWQLKIPQGEARLELEAPGGPRSIPEDLVKTIVGLLRGRALAPIATLRTRRSGVRVVENGASVADVTVDRVAIMDGRRIAERFEELEVESLDGDQAALDRLAMLLRESGALPSDGRPKVFRTFEFPRETRPAFSEEAEYVRAAIEKQFEEVLRHDPGTRLGLDLEDLHKFRVATRRLRAILRAAGPLLDREWADALRDELSWLAGVAGPVRDLDVLLEHLDAERAELDGDERAAASGLLAGLVAERAEARAALLEAMSDERYLRLLDRLEAASRNPPLLAVDVTLKGLAAGEFSRLEKAVKSTGLDASDDELHKLRIRGKRARYAAELAEPAIGKRATKFVDAAKRFQDVIGEHQDAVVAEERIRALMPSSAEARVAFAAGLLVARERRRRRDARAAVGDAWKRLERAGTRAFA